MDPLKKIEQQMVVEIHKQIDIYYSAVSLALHRNWGWGKERIATMYEATQTAWNECAATNKVSMVQMLENETGIELQNGDGKSWHDLCYLNNDHPANHRKMTRPQFIYMRTQQLKWMGTNVFACILLGLHRKYGFGAERLARVVAQTVEIREQYDFDKDRLLKECKKETGINIQDKEDMVG